MEDYPLMMSDLWLVSCTAWCGPCVGPEILYCLWLRDIYNWLDKCVEWGASLESPFRKSCACSTSLSIVVDDMLFGEHCLHMSVTHSCHPCWCCSKALLLRKRHMSLQLPQRCCAAHACWYIQSIAKCYWFCHQESCGSPWYHNAKFSWIWVCQIWLMQYMLAFQYLRAFWQVLHFGASLGTCLWHPIYRVPYQILFSSWQNLYT